MTPDGPVPIEIEVEQRRETELDEDGRRELAERVRATRRFVDRERGSRALRWALEVARELDEVDGDTVTYHLIRALELTPDDDELLLEYLREVADTDYYYTDRTLAGLAGELRDPGRARELALAGTLAELWVLGSYLSQSSPPGWAADAARRAFAVARSLGADESAWQATRTRVLDQLRFRGDPAADAWARWAPPT